MALRRDENDIVYEENRVLLDAGSSSLQTAVSSSPSSVDQLRQLNGGVDVAAAAAEEERFISPPPLPLSSPEHSLDEISARGKALSVLTRIARHIGRNVDDLLTSLLPHSGSESLLNPRGEQLVHWGRLIHSNCTHTGPEGFVSGIPVASVADPTALANLHALAAWPVNKRRVHLLGDSMDYLEQLLRGAVAGFPVLLEEKDMEVELATFLLLVKFILQDEASFYKSEADEVMLSAHDDCVEVRETDLDPVDVLFMDESRIASDTVPSATTTDSGSGAVARQEERLRLAPSETEDGLIVISPGGVESLVDDTMQDPKVKKICVELPSPHKAMSHSRPKGQLAVGQFHVLRASGTAKAIQLALLLLPPLLRYQLQVFVEIAQDITAHIQAHVRPTSRYIAKPKTLAMAFAPRFFGVPKNPKESMGEALLEFILGDSTPLRLLKPPLGALDSPAKINTRAAKSSPQRVSPIERKVRGRQPLKALIDFDNISVATGTSDDLHESTDTRINPHHLPLSEALLHLPVCSPESYKNISQMATQRALLDTLNCLLSDSSMAAGQKLEYLKRYQKAHPDILQLRFAGEEELKQLMDRLEEEVASKRESGLKDRVVDILCRRRRRRSHLGGKKRRLTPLR